MAIGVVYDSLPHRSFSVLIFAVFSRLFLELLRDASSREQRLRVQLLQLQTGGGGPQQHQLPRLREGQQTEAGGAEDWGQGLGGRTMARFCPLHW